MSEQHSNIEADVEQIKRISVVPTILEVICRTTGLGFATIARVTSNEWIACAVRDEIQFGLQAGEQLELETTLCREVEVTQEIVVINNVAEDNRFSGHRSPAIYGYQSYISVPIMLKNGSFFGTLCAIDPKPALLNNPKTIGMFKLFAELIAFHLNALVLLAVTETNLLEERKTAELRDQFIAVLGHDLRNPLGAIGSSAQLLKRTSLPERSLNLVNIIQDSSIRMSGLIENVLDFARGRLGGGLSLNQASKESLEPILNHVIEELRIIWPERTIKTIYNLTEPVYCDSARIAQLFSNILGNALTYSNADSPVTVKASSNTSDFILSVSNNGDQISNAAMDRLFQPFFRGDVESKKQGLGLGLYISAEIARAHGGKLNVFSTPNQTTFTLQMAANREDR